MLWAWQPISETWTRPNFGCPGHGVLALIRTSSSGKYMSTTQLPTGLLERLAEVRTQCPELRLGQFISTVGLLAEDETGRSLWEVEEAEFAVALERFANDLARRES